MLRTSVCATCLGDQFFAPAVAHSVRLLRSLGVEVDFPADQTCCGQPAFNAGYDDEARRMARHTIRVFADSERVVLPSGSCAAMLRASYPQLLAGDGPASEASRALGTRTYELAEFIVRVLEVTDLGDGLRDRRIAYHHGCHALRELGLEDEAPLLLRRAGAEVLEWEADRECCGFGGLFSVKLPRVSAAMADRKLDTLPSPDVLTSADPGCLLHLAGRSERRADGPPVRHLASLLWEARTGASGGAGEGADSPDSSAPRHSAESRDSAAPGSSAASGEPPDSRRGQDP